MTDFAIDLVGTSHGLYSITSSLSKDKAPIWITAPELITIYDYALLHMSEIEKAAKQMERNKAQRNKPH
jgi:hypothetical protein